MSKAPSRTKRAKRRPSRRNASRKPTAIVPSTRDFREEEERWGAFQEWLEIGVRVKMARENAASQYDTPRSYLKRETYRYVLERQEDGRAKELQTCIELARESRVPAIPSFAQNPFNWALLGVQPIDGLKLRSDDVSRFGRQLAYAAQHNVPPQLLIGFISQTGSPSLISRKYSCGEREEWHGSLQRTPVVRLRSNLYAESRINSGHEPSRLATIVMFHRELAETEYCQPTSAGLARSRSK